VQASIAAEGRAKANGSVLGYTVASRAVVERKLILEGKADVGLDTPLYVESSFRAGKEPLKKTAASPGKEAEKPAGIRVVGEIVFTGWSVKTYRLEPQILMHGT